MSAERAFLDHLHALDVPILTAKPEGTDYERPGRWQLATPDGNAARIKAWQPGHALLGVMGGRVVVLDVDTKNGADPAKVVALRDGIGVRVYADVLTPSGGRHFYVAGHPDLPTVHATEGRDGLTGYPGLEVISYGANVFLPGTLRRKYDGAGYVILSDDLERLADGGDDDSAQALASWVAEHRTSRGEAFTPSPPWDGAPPDKRQAAYLEAVLARQADELAAMRPESGRNHALYLAGLKCGSFVAGAGMDEAQVVARLTDAAERCGLLADDGPRSVAASLRSGLGNGRKNPRAMPPAKGDDLSWIGARVDLNTGEVLEASQEDSGGQDDPGERARRLFPRLDWHALWDDDEEEEWIHEPLLAARRLVSLYSAPKVGKSLLMLELAVGISRGEAVLGYTPTRRWRVLYVDFENDPRGDVRSRLQAMGYGPDDLDHVDYLSFPTMAGLDSERGGCELLEAVMAYASEVVVIDTVSRAVDGEENSNDTWLGLYRHTGLKLKQAGVAAIRLDHSGKDESKGTRGGSAKSGDVDAIWKLTRVTEERFRLECTESRMQIDTKSLQLTRRRLPRLHHSVDVLSGVSDREAKVLHLLDLANANGLAADANREAIRELAKIRGIGVRNDVLAEVVKRRKLSPTLGDSPSDEALSPAEGTAGTADAPKPQSEHETTCPRPPGTGGDNPHRPHLSPGQQYLTAPVGTAGQADLAEMLEELGGACSTCSRFVCNCEAAS